MLYTVAHEAVNRIILFLAAGLYFVYFIIVKLLIKIVLITLLKTTYINIRLSLLSLTA